MRSRWLFVAVLASIMYVAAVGTAAYAATVTVRTGSYYFGSGSVTANVGDQLRFVMEDGGKGTPTPSKSMHSVSTQVQSSPKAHIQPLSC